jgi:hypothetical protein
MLSAVLLERAYRSHYAKRFAEAARFYRAILDDHATDPEAILAARQLENLKDYDAGRSSRSRSLTNIVPAAPSVSLSRLARQ